MLLWLRQQRKDPPADIPLHPGWLWAFVGLLMGLTAFGMWMEMNLPQDGARRAMLASVEHAYERNLGIALMIGLSASLLVRWRSRYGMFVRYGVYWLIITGICMIGYAAWFGLFS